MNTNQEYVQEQPRPHPAWSFLGGGWLHSPGGGVWSHRPAGGAAQSLDGMTWSSHRQGCKKRQELLHYELDGLIHNQYATYKVLIL